jgi:hypothetical protein
VIMRGGLERRGDMESTSRRDKSRWDNLELIE